MNFEIKKPKINLDGKKKKSDVVKGIVIETKSMDEMIKNIDKVGKDGKPKIGKVEIKKRKMKYEFD